MLTDKEISLMRSIAELRVENEDLKLRIIQLEAVVGAARRYFTDQKTMSLEHARTALEVVWTSSNLTKQDSPTGS